MTSAASAPKRRIWLRVLVVIGVLALLGVGTFATLLWSWTDVARVAQPEADAAFAEALQLAGGGPAYLEFPEQGEFSVRHELESAEKARIRGLHAVVWQPDRGRLVRLDLPGWFVRTKTRASFGLETLVSEAGIEWNSGHELTSEDLARFGHGLVLDRSFGNGARVLVWQEAEPRP
jgi:hypothetical protein